MADAQSGGILDNPVYRELRDLLQALNSGDPNDAPLLVNISLGRRFQQLLSSCDENLDGFGAIAKLNSGDLNQISQGQFTRQSTKKIVETLDRLAPKFSSRLTQYRIEWVSLRSDDVSKLVARVRKPLENLHTILHQSNELAASQSLITEAEKVQLIALLKSLLAELEGNFVERGRLKSITNWFGSLLRKSGEQAINDYVPVAIKASVGVLSDLIEALRDKPSNSVPDDPAEPPIEV